MKLMPDCDENMVLCYIVRKNFKACAQLVTSSVWPIDIMNINSLSRDVIR